MNHEIHPDEIHPDELTPEQIQNWRNAIFGLIGPSAFIMTEAGILVFRKRFQKWIDDIIEKEKTKDEP
jgi:hypothetical protein